MRSTAERPAGDPPTPDGFLAVTEPQSRDARKAVVSAAT